MVYDKNEKSLKEMHGVGGKGKINLEMEFENYIIIHVSRNNCIVSS